ncbi:hypothetical protein [Flavobacterium sp. I3-2]|uniref:hypothetical protein n=1 Tax=Flavobacterium sp. I3-2 TaxID=2748319 RepID=UPI0015AF14F9|nr:hypothetical protein [Flavobacterium sp. I3-2]
MDKYKENFEKGAQRYIKLLEEIKWFDNPHVNKEEIIERISNTTFPPYYATYLTQLAYESDYSGEDQLTDVLNAVMQFIPNSEFEINEGGIIIKINDNEYPIKLNVEKFEVGEGSESFVETTINEILKNEGSNYLFFELPPDDEVSSLIFVKPEIYKLALEKGIIPDFMGYYAVNY